MIKGRLGEIYNFTNREYVSISSLVKKICSLNSISFKKLIKITKDRPSKDAAYRMNPTKAENELNWKPKYTLEEGLKKTIRWYKSNKRQLSRLKNIYIHKP